MEAVFNIAVILFLVFANAFFVAAEFALVRVRRTRVQALIDEGNATATVVRSCIDHLDDYISATQVGITLASLALGWRGEPVVAHLLEPAFERFLTAETAQVWSHGIAVGIAFFFITFLHVVLGELMPKSLALQFPEKTSLWIARPMRFCAYLFRPLIWLLNGTSARLLRAMGVQPAEHHSLALSEEELLIALSESKKAGVVSEDEQKMLQRVFKFHDKTVREIMIPRPDIAALPLNAGIDEIKTAFEEGYSRLPVFDKNLNNIKGIVYVKDLIYTLQDPHLIKLVDLLREAIFVPESMPVSTLLRDFQKSKVHMAIVVDEFGDTAGLVTLEDVIEEIVGEIQDEYDYEPAQVQRKNDGTLIFDGKTPLDRFREIFPNYELPEGSFETIAGLVFLLAGRVPKEGDSITSNGLVFRIVKRDGRRLKKIGVGRLAGRSEPAHKAVEHPENEHAPSPTTVATEAAETMAAAATHAPSDGDVPPTADSSAAAAGPAEPLGEMANIEGIEEFHEGDDEEPKHTPGPPRPNVRNAPRPAPRSPSTNPAESSAQR